MDRNDFNIRPMKAEDYPNVYQLWQQMPNPHISDLDDSFDEISRLLRFNPGFCFVAETDDHQIIGSALGATDGRRGTIYHLVTDPMISGTDLKRTLANLIIKKLKAVKIHKMSVTVLDDNQDDQLFWKSLKFVNLDNTKRYDKII
ncbi:GNAT family N-acetyltransferase [Lentilactobacillus kefiri]|uniref:N-acetyltransferase n=2 Tax=Lentilactobacillus kefiri TaxID=33962 RepID=A0A511DR87_LENKE|nr:GNAT family N-acetyltransferase [Lentilactobacillus kefiri]KRL62690.1 N-acetyltransferase GCN5 [Lentilactobacillus parakefiri DSM 10551]MCJ2160643.1 GNAT family N-acetyltransferase [Lentilactobacillus kefiri]MCP9367898.1 GNAT family N-acetyltransferase [Lentilactobacillus kefiri]MDH5107552.1 GNAT family N-acetyltransferase [Lentilactobacillus kefiri]MDM7491928.1 GNAT family N-acetyltransferase [Lentilactobacillus kefiri]